MINKTVYINLLKELLVYLLQNKGQVEQEGLHKDIVLGFIQKT